MRYQIENIGTSEDAGRFTVRATVRPRGDPGQPVTSPPQDRVFLRDGSYRQSEEMMDRLRAYMTGATAELPEPAAV